MPYDSNGNWVLPQAASAWDEDTDLEEALQTLRESGDIEAHEDLSNILDLKEDQWEDKKWETQITGEQRLNILKVLKDRGHIIGGDPLPEGWGIQYEREWGDLDLGGDELDSAIDRYHALIGDDYDIDYAHYNSNLAYRSTVQRLGLSDLRTPFNSVRQIREAHKILQEPGYDWDRVWVETHAMPYNDDEVGGMFGVKKVYDAAVARDFGKHNPVRHFDPDTNITTFMNPQDSRSLSLKLYEARAAGNYHQLKEPGSPQFINVISGEVPKAEYTPEGQRIVTDNDIRQIYQRYLGRDYNSSEPGVGIGQEEIDYWQGSIATNNWDYETFEKAIASSPEASMKSDKGKAYFNPNAGKEAEITSKLVAEPAKMNPPDLTIRKVTVKQPDNIDSGWRVPGV